MHNRIENQKLNRQSTRNPEAGPHTGLSAGSGGASSSHSNSDHFSARLLHFLRTIFVGIRRRSGVVFVALLPVPVVSLVLAGLSLLFFPSLSQALIALFLVSTGLVVAALLLAFSELLVRLQTVRDQFQGRIMLQGIQFGKQGGFGFGSQGTAGNSPSDLDELLDQFEHMDLNEEIDDLELQEDELQEEDGALVEGSLADSEQADDEQLRQKQVEEEQGEEFSHAASKKIIIH